MMGYLFSLLIAVSRQCSFNLERSSYGKRRKIKVGLAHDPAGQFASCSPGARKPFRKRIASLEGDPHGCT